jgi:ribosome-associated toxin RatA of RatAB toxin-antitoxin module
VLTGESTIEVDASPQACFDVVVDIAGYPEWQTQVRSATVLERDGEGRALVAETVSDAKVRTLRYRLRYAYDAPRGMSWALVDGDVKGLDGDYRFEALDGGRTRVTFRLSVDPGRRLGLLLRGPLATEVRDYVMGTTLDELKATVERGGV